MNGSVSLVRTLLENGVAVCFANPGTSEMHFVAALDSHPDMRCVLCLFEGGATGAADGYYRMAGRPAATLMHLSPGLGNGFANLHNARKAHSAIVNVVGDHATYHLNYESPLRGQTVALSQSVSHWTRMSDDSAAVARDGADAIRAAKSQGGQIATLILPADTAWGPADRPQISTAPAPLHRPSADQIAVAARALTAPGAALLIDGPALLDDLAELAGRIATRSGCRLIAPYTVSRIRRGDGAIAIERLGYPVAHNRQMLSSVGTLVLCGAEAPVSFFAYPDQPSLATPPECEVMALCGPTMDIGWTLTALADALDASQAAPLRIAQDLPALPTGALTLEAVADAIAALMPRDAIVVDEGITSVRPTTLRSLTARAHDWLHTTGGAIGQGLPCAVGAAIACPDRRVLALMGDGAAMYTLQSLWTMAREELDVTIVVFANRGYQILHSELTKVGAAAPGRNAARMLDVTAPDLDWVALAAGHGVRGSRVSDADGFVAALKRALETPGPCLIEVPC